jgi:hypothetical protein
MKRRIKLSESDLHRVIKESVKKVLSENRLSKKYLRESWSDENEDDWNDPYNFFPNKDFSKNPTHRIEYFFGDGGSISSPSIFTSDEDAINTALENPKGFENVVGVRVVKYVGKRDNGNYKLDTIYEDGKTY